MLSFKFQFDVESLDWDLEHCFEFWNITFWGLEL